MTINDWCLSINEWAHSKGFWGNHIRATVVEKVLLAVTELSEAYECLRDDPNPLNYIVSDNGKPEGFPIEIADCVIRLFDLCGELGIDLDRMIGIKMSYNQTRPWKHGRHESST